MRTVLEQTRRMSGRAFLERLTAGLSEILDGAYVQIGRVSADGRSIHAEPCAQHGALLDGGIDYELHDTPCEHVVGASTCYFDGDLIDRFPEDLFLVEAGFVSYLGCPMFDSSGRPAGLLSVMSTRCLSFCDADLALFEALTLRAGADMERVGAIEARLASETLFREIVDQQTEMVCRFSRDGRVSFANRAYRETFGIDEEALATLDYNTLVHPEDRERVHLALARIGPEEPRVTIENRVFTADGRVLWTAWTNIGLHDRDGNLVGYQAAGRDVTAAKLAQERLREAHEQKDRFLAMLAHELRNPLGAISNALAVLELSHRQGRHDVRAMAIAKRQAQQQARLLDDLLDLSRITRGQVRLCMADLPLFQCVREVVEAKRAAFASKSQSLSVDLPSRDVLVHADRVRLEQVVANLLDNASKYTPDQGWIRAEGRITEKTAAVRIVDSGRGVPPTMRERIFDMFQQVSDEGSFASGLGIGLTVVRELVSLHGGSVTVDSSGEGRGSTFTVELPIRSGILPTEPACPAATPSSGRRCRILVVDDNEDVADTLADLLREWGHDVRVTYDGESALRLIEHERPALVLMDIAMPGLDGYATARAVWARVPPPLPMLVALTGFGQPVDVQRSRDARFDHHLTKPVDHAALRELIEACAQPPGGPSHQRIDAP